MNASTLIEAATKLRPVVREYQARVEREGQIPQELVQQLRAAGLYRLLVPTSLGGYQIDLVSFMRIAELISEGDGSVGWNLANTAVQQLIALGLPDEGVDEVFGCGPDVLIAGTAVPGGGIGMRVKGGFIVSGRWSFGSACRESQWMFANFDVVDETGQAELYRVYFPAEECSIVEGSWDMTGMLGTGSLDWFVEELFVPRRRTVLVPGRLLSNQWQRWEGTLYALPVHAWVGPHQSVCATGIARAGIEALAELAVTKVPRGQAALLRERESVQDAVARAEAILSAAQAYRTAVLSEVWETVAAGAPTSVEQHARCRLAATFAVDSARQAMDLVFRAGGTTSTRRTHRLAHCWRDLQVVAQAASVTPDWYALAGRVLLGMDAAPRLT